MTETPQGRKRRVDRYSRPEDITPKTAPRAGVKQARAPIGRSQELLERQEQLRQPMQPMQPVQPVQMKQPVRNQRQMSTYSDFDASDFSACAAKPIRKKKRRDSHTFLWLMVAFICLMATGVLLMFAAPQLLGVAYDNMPNYAFVNGSIVSMDSDVSATHEAYRQFMQGDRIYSGVYIDGVHVGGMTRAEAAEAVSQVAGNEGSSFAITVDVDGNIWSIDSNTVPLYRNIDEVVMQAYAVGRMNTTAIRGTSTTPFRQRLSTVQDALTNPRVYYTETTYDRDVVRGMVDGIAASVNREPVNASVATFDTGKKTFSFNSDESGVFIDADAIYQTVTGLLDSGVYQETVWVEPQVLLASVTKAELMNSFGLVSSFTTNTTSSANRNTNIRLSAEAISNRTVLPGETFSFNQATGQRTEAKGYKPAAAIAGGETFDEIGGGVCQTSSTLFNAVARANLAIVDRDPHAWPSNYVDKGEDATVNWPNLDFRFKNDTEWPIFIVAYYKDRKVTVEIYGKTLGEGVTIDLVSETTYVKEPPKIPLYVYNPELKVGQEKTTVKARTGYTVETYKVWYKNGQEIKREKLHTSHYKMYQQTIEYNDGQGGLI